ncbi:uncharacterized protein [Montipora capricornis]|uniref:uncharacterized protein n=1 Tax=Montipora capricornis TaxID=246305 RepID=UPI0035F12B7A
MIKLRKLTLSISFGAVLLLLFLLRQYTKVPNGQQKRARLHLIVSFYLVSPSGTPMNSTEVERQMEYVDCLQRNLLSPHVEAIHILFESQEEKYRIEALRLRMDWKLVFHFLGRRMRYKDAFEYASLVLIRKNAMIMNADNYIDTGFENLDETILGNKTMYALTRHETAENVRLCGVTDFCGQRANYIGSHDAFLFRLLAPLSREFLDKVDYVSNLEGIEQVLMFNLRKYERFTIKNPCRILRIVHQHCVDNRKQTERTIQGKRIDRYLNIYRDHRAPFSGL